MVLSPLLFLENMDIQLKMSVEQSLKCLFEKHLDNKLEHMEESSVMVSYNLNPFFLIIIYNAKFTL